MPKTILITGGSGFVGSNLSISLKEYYHDVRVIALDNLRRRGSELNLGRQKARGIECIHGDVRLYSDIDLDMPIDIIIDCSAEPSALAGITSSPSYVLDTNLVGTLNCLELARKKGALFVFLSTSRIYPTKMINDLKYLDHGSRFELSDEQQIGGASKNGISEAFPLTGSRSLYGASKLASELVIQEYVELLSVPAVIFRCGTLTGPWQMGKIEQGFVPLWVASHLWGGSLSYLGFGGEGKQVRDLLHIEDLARLIVEQLKKDEALTGQTYNVGGGLANSVSLCELTKKCEELTGNSLQIQSEPVTAPTDIKYYVSDNAKIESALDWRPEIGVDDILSHIARWLMDHRERLEKILLA